VGTGPDKSQYGSINVDGEYGATGHHPTPGACQKQTDCYQKLCRGEMWRHLSVALVGVDQDFFHLSIIPYDGN
jgi:hypothetical protein